jgi:hypothetical protein
MSFDEYGDSGKVAGAQWATMDTVLPDKGLSVHNTLHKGHLDGVVFWMTADKPKEMLREAWEAYTQDRWDRAFGKGKYASHVELIGEH